MYLADRLRYFRVAKNLSQGDIEARTGLKKCYISRVENGHTVPSVETLEKIANACGLKLYQLFYEIGEAVPAPQVADKDDWASHGKGSRVFTRISQAVRLVTDDDRNLILRMARLMSARKKDK